jgi:ATP-binding cassette subfamily F protein 3
MALQSFNGAILLISHDRHLLSSSVDTFYLVDNGSVELFDGNLDDYKDYILNLNTPKSKKIEKEIPSEKLVEKDNSQKIRLLKSELSKLDKRNERLNRKLKEVNDELADPELYSGDGRDDLQNLLKNQLELTDQIEEIEKIWMSKVEELESY